MERDYMIENIVLTFSVRDLCVIGKTLSDRYTGSEVNIFINPLNKALQGATSLDENVPVSIPVSRLFEVIEILGKQSEFLYNEFNKSVEAKLTAQLEALAENDAQMVGYISTKLDSRKDRIQAYQEGLIKGYVRAQDLEIDISNLELPQLPEIE